MLKNAKKRTGAIAVAALLTAPAFGWEEGDEQPVSVVVIDQVQLGNVWSGMSVDVPNDTADAVSTSTAVGNAAAGLVKSGDVQVAITQTLDGNVEAQNTLSGYSAGTAIATTTAYGNASTGGTWMGSTDYDARQVSNGNVSADTRISLAGANQIATATTAIANVSVPSNEYGENAAYTEQESNGSVSSNTTAVMCCDNTSATFVTTAGANAVSSNGWTSTNITGAVQTTAAGQTVQAASDLYMGDGNDVLVATTGFGNSATLQNEWGYASLGQQGAELYQENGSNIDTQTYVTLDHWSGYASASAYGVGNSGLISNIGSDTAAYAVQDNSGTIYTSANLTGNSSVGGTGIVNATSIGNAITATLCNYCDSDSVLAGGVRQINSGQVIARGTAFIPNSGGIFGSATAVGNSATFQSSGD